MSRGHPEADCGACSGLTRTSETQSDMQWYPAPDTGDRPLGVVDTRALASQPPSVRTHLLPASVRAGSILERGGCEREPSFPRYPSARLPYAKAWLPEAPVSPAGVSPVQPWDAPVAGSWRLNPGFQTGLEHTQASESPSGAGQRGLGTIPPDLCRPAPGSSFSSHSSHPSGEGKEGELARHFRLSMGSVHLKMRVPRPNLVT